MIRTLLTKLFYGLGYVGVLLEWFFVAAVYLSVASRQAWFNDLFTAAPQPIAPQTESVVNSSLEFGGIALFIVSVIVTCVIFGAILYMLRHLPGTVFRGGEKVVHMPAEALAPFLLKHTHVKPTKRRRLQLTEQLAFVMKCLGALLPFVFYLPIELTGSGPVEAAVAWTVLGFLACMSLVWFWLGRIVEKLASSHLAKAD